MPRIVLRERAEADIDEIADTIARRNLAAGRGFYDAILADLQQLSAMPRMGARRRAKTPTLKGLRSWPVGGYRNYLIFYFPIDNGIDVLRVLHGAREVDRIIDSGP